VDEYYDPVMAFFKNMFAGKKKKHKVESVEEARSKTASNK
jgi:hypothetical protein